MKYVWVDRGNDPAYSVLEKHGIDGCFFDIRDERLNTAYLKGVRVKGYAVGVYVETISWPELRNLTPEGAAEWTAAQVVDIVPEPLERKAAFPKVQFDIEAHDPDYVQRCLTRWREMFPKQDTSWSLEGGQGGWMTPEFVAAVVALKVRVSVQLYNGSMSEQWDSLAYTRDLTKRGFPDALISPTWDAKALPKGWDGWCFTMGRLPQ